MFSSNDDTVCDSNNQDLRVESGDVLKDIRRNGKEFDWRGKKIKNRYYAEILEILHFKKANNVRGCADEMSFKITDDGYLRLHQVWFCKSKLCPLCAWRRSMKFSYQMLKFFQKLSSRNLKHVFFFNFDYQKRF